MQKETQIRSRISRGETTDAALEKAPHLREAVTILRPLEEVYAFWRDFSKLPLYMKDLVRVDELSPTRSRWVLDLPRGPQTEWIAEIVAERPNEMISWETREGDNVQQAGTVHFQKAGGGRGTVVSLTMKYTITGGKVTELATKVMGEDPKTLAMSNLRRFKAYLETGEVPTVEGQPSGREELTENKNVH